MKKNSLVSIALSTVLASSVYGADKLENVVVTSKSNQTLENTAGSISVITEEDIKQMNATSVQEILEEVVGINVGINDSSIGGRQTISIRGTDSKHSLILLDGKKVSGTDAQIGHSDFQYSWLPISAIKKIEIVRGPMSALYGSKAIGGVVNIITKRPIETFGGEIAIKKGWSASNGGDEKDISLSLGGKITEKLSISGFIEKKDVELTYKKGDKTATSDREGKEITNKMITAWYEIDDTQQISATYLTGDEVREQQEYSSRSKKTTKYDEYYDIDKQHYSIGYQKSFENVSMDLKYYNTSSDSNTEKFKYTHEIEDKVVSAEFKVDVIDNNFIVLGMEKSTEKYKKNYDDSSKNAISGFNGEIDNTSFYLQDEIEINDDTLLVFGARHDKHEKFGGQFTPKANIVYKLNENHRLKAGYGEGFNAPTVTQNSSNYEFSGRHVFKGNDDLKPETSKSFELGYEGKIDNTTIKTTIFKTEVKNLIDGLFVNSAPLFPGSPLIKNTYLYGNIDEVSIKGFEFEFDQKQLLSNVDFNLGYNYLKTEDKSTGKELLAKPKHKLNLKLSSQLPLDIKSTLRVKYTGSQYNGDYKKQSAYTTVGLQLSKEIIKNLTARVGAENLTNKQLKDTDNYQLKGRVIYFGLNYKF
jgi:outer membrane receptor for ferrienterochelin and colicin